MLEQDNEPKLRERLILAGLNELEEHGIKDFSLRRVSVKAEVSCAAPYRHFKDKNELILEILNYVKEGWDLLSYQIKEAYKNNSVCLITELCASFIRFWIANGNFRSVLILAENNTNEKFNELFTEFDKSVITEIECFSLEHSLNEEPKEQLVFTILSLTYGTLSVINKKKISSEKSITLLKQKIGETLQSY